MTEDQNDAPVKRSTGLSAKRLIPIAALVLGLVAFFAFGLDDHITLQSLKDNRDALTSWVDRTGVVAGIIFATIYAVAVAFSIPGGVILTIVGGFMFGPFAATLYVVFGATIGATALFLAARYAFAEFLRAKTGGALKKMEAGFNEHPFSYMLILRLVPLFPFWLVNLVPAFLGASLTIYILSTFFGIIPGTFVFALLGDGAGAVLDAGGDLNLDMIFEPRFLAPILGLAVLASIPVFYEKLRSRKGNAA